MARTRIEFDLYAIGAGDEDPPVARVVAGPIDFVLAERKYGSLGKQDGALEPNLHIAYTAGQRAGIGKDLEFIEWIKTYDPEAVDDGSSDTTDAEGNG